MKFITRAQRKRFWVVYLLMILLLIPIISGLIRHGAGISSYDQFCIILLVVLGYVLIRRRRAYIKAYQDNSRLHGTVNYVFSDVGMEVSGEGFSASYSWSALGRIEVLPDMVLVYQTPMTANIILKKFLSDEQANWLAAKEIATVHKMTVNTA